jgi:hypothetical protein
MKSATFFAFVPGLLATCLSLVACAPSAGPVESGAGADTTTDAGGAVSVQFVAPTPADESTVSGLVTFEVTAI